MIKFTKFILNDSTHNWRTVPGRTVPGKFSVFFILLFMLN